MSFEITARTILHLGADLITSDAVALYELIKNAIDAKSPSGVTVSVEIVISRAEFDSAMSLLDADGRPALPELKSNFLKRLVPDSSPETRLQFENTIQTARSLQDLRERARAAYRVCNRIVVSDEGHGMTSGDLKDVYLKIGTPSRTLAVRTAVEQHKGDPADKAPYLGEKGIGRLSVMRLGWIVRVETATAEDARVNVLEIDWKRFEEAFDQPLASVRLKPALGESKAAGTSFTRIIISDLRASWTRQSLMEVARNQIARMMDPFSWDSPRRFPIRLKFNGTTVDQARTVARDLLASAHGTCEGEFSIQEGIPTLKVVFNSSLLDGPKVTHVFDVSDLVSMAGLKKSGSPSSTLRALGPFKFELYWFNRQRLRATEGVGDREAVRALLRAWVGVSLFRDGYRVLPYGDEGDDWLMLDREALASGGYKLNTKQIIGRVRIGRLTNPRLLDQTNRQGLVDCPEKQALVILLNDIITHWWHDYLDESTVAQKSKKALTFDTVKEVGGVEELEKRTREAIKTIRRSYTGEESVLQQVKDAFAEIKDAHERAVARINTIEEQKERLIELAGIGLMIEVIAHELTRATEATQKTLKAIQPRRVDAETASAFKSLAAQIKVIQKRLQTLDPLTVTARQRRSMVDVHKVVSYVLEGHSEQFARHGITAKVSGAKGLQAFVIEGHVVQILENLINNSIYWLDIEKSEHPHFEGRIDVELSASPPTIRYGDNGPGIPRHREDLVFEPFFSTKESSGRRKGLGLYIARQNAEFLGGTLSLTDLGSVHEDRFNTFELEMRSSAGG